MTISQNEALASGPYPGNGVAAAFDYDFTIYVATELEVRRINAAGTSDLLALGVDYTVEGVAVPGGGRIILTNPTQLPTGTLLTIEPSITPSQDRPFSTQSSTTLAQYEAALDKLTSLVRQAIGGASRTLRLRVGASPGQDIPALVPGSVLAVRANGDGIEMGPSITAITASVGSAGAAAAEAAASAVAAADAAGTAIAEAGEATEQVNTAQDTVAAFVATAQTASDQIAADAQTALDQLAADAQAAADQIAADAQLRVAAFQADAQERIDEFTALYGGGPIQAQDDKLDALAALTLSSNRGIYATGADTLGTFNLTASGRSFLGAGSATTQRAALGIELPLGQDQQWSTPANTVAGTAYQNTTGRAIGLYVPFVPGGGENVAVSPTGAFAGEAAVVGLSSGASVVNVFTVVPAGHFYRITGGFNALNVKLLR